MYSGIGGSLSSCADVTGSWWHDDNVTDYLSGTFCNLHTYNGWGATLNYANYTNYGNKIDFFCHYDEYIGTGPFRTIHHVAAFLEGYPDGSFRSGSYVECLSVSPPCP